MSLTLIVGSPKDAENYLSKKSEVNLVFKYPEHYNSIKDIEKVVYYFLSNYKYDSKYILTESIYVIGYLTLLQKANHLLDKGVELDEILHSMENFVKIDSNNVKAFELNGDECKDLIVTYDGKTRIISDENYPNQLIKQISVDYDKLMDLADILEELKIND